MAHDFTIPPARPGIAEFRTESYGNSGELLFGDTPAQVEKSRVVTTAAPIDFPLGSVVNVAEDGTITMATSTAGASNATGILAAPLLMAAGQTFSVPLYEAGHYRQQALTFDASFNTDELKQNAFKGSDTPMILISKAKYDDADHPA